MARYRSRRSTLGTVCAIAAVLSVATVPAAAATDELVIAWTRSELEAHRSRIWAAAGDMTDQRLVSESGKLNGWDPAVRPDGGEIAFVGAPGAFEPEADRHGIYTVDPSGAALTRWTSTPPFENQDANPIWSADGSALYFLRPGSAGYTMMRITAPGATPTPVGETDATPWDGLSMSPDAGYVAYARQGAVYIERLTGGDTFVIRPASTSRLYSRPQWSPDGRLLSVLASDADGNTGIELVETSGLGSTVVTARASAADGSVSSAAWSPDGAHLYYSTHRPASAGWRSSLLRIPAAQGATPVLLQDVVSDEVSISSPHAGGGAGVPADGTAPILSGLSVTSAGTTAVGLRYALAGDRPDAARFVVRYQIGPVAPTTLAEGTAAYDGLRRKVFVRSLAPDTQYSFSVFAVDWAGNTSAPVSVTATTARTTSLTSTTSTSSVVYGDRVTIAGRLTDTATGSPLAGRSVTLHGRTAPTSPWRQLGTRTTDTSGAVSVVSRPTSGWQYQWRYALADRQGSAVSPIRTVTYAPRLTAAFADATIRLGGSAYLRGSHAPSAGPWEFVYLQRYYAGAWHGAGRVRLTSSSTYSIKITPTRAGTYVYRVLTRPTGPLRRYGISPTRRLYVS